MVVVAAEREGGQARGEADTLRGDRVQPTRGVPQCGGGYRYSPYRRPHGPTGSTAEAVQRISCKASKLLRRM